MNKNRLPETDQDLSLQDPLAWSPEARNFLEIASWSTLDDLKDVSGTLLISAVLFLKLVAE